MKEHELKTWPEDFEAIWSGKKNFEVRVNDRHFKVGDGLRLREWHPGYKIYTGREYIKKITYMLQGSFGLPDGLCVMQLGEYQ